MSNTVDVVNYDQAVFPDLLQQDPEAVRLRFAKRFMASETIDDLFGVLNGNTSKNLVGRKVEITGVQWAPYKSDRGIIPNAICDAIDLVTGEVLEFATTSESLTLFIRRAEMIDAIPFKAKITETKTRDGFTALNFEPA